MILGHIQTPPMRYLLTPDALAEMALQATNFMAYATDLDRYNAMLDYIHRNHSHLISDEIQEACARKAVTDGSST